jgi:hypothetical protein
MTNCQFLIPTQSPVTKGDCTGLRRSARSCGGEATRRGLSPKSEEVNRQGRQGRQVRTGAYHKDTKTQSGQALCHSEGAKRVEESLRTGSRVRHVSVSLSFVGIILFAGCRNCRAPETPATPWGTSVGFVGGASVLTSLVQVPELDSVAVRFDWGDGVVSDWSPWTWRDTVRLGHRWAESGTYDVRAQVKFGSGRSSDWSGTHKVAVTGTRIRSYGGAGSEAALSAALTADGGLIVVGATELPGSPVGSIWLLRTDSSGDTVWTKTFGPHGSGSAVGSSVVQTRDGGCVVAGWGERYLNSEGDLLLIKTDAGGDTVWTRQLDMPGSQGGACIQQTSDDGYIIVGTTAAQQSDNRDIWLVKTDENGDTSWTRTFGGSEQQDGHSVQQTGDGGYIVLGTTWSRSGMRSWVMLTKTDAEGHELWTHTYGGDHRDWATSVRQTSDGGYILTGNTEAASLLGGALLLKTDADGNLIWQKMLGGTGGWLGKSVEPTSDGGYIIAGYAFSYVDDHTDAWLVKTDAVGDVIWDAGFGRVSYSDGVAALEAPGGGYLLAGSTCPDSTDVSDVWVIKTGAEGRVCDGGK